MDTTRSDAPLAVEAPAAALPRRRASVLTLLSFGFKYGPPPANNYFDVSFLKNPARDERWSLWAEPDESMRRFVLDQPAAREFLEAVLPLLRVLARCDDDARVAFGCSAGRHRSTILAEELARRLGAESISTRVVHREGTFA